MAPSPQERRSSVTLYGLPSERKSWRSVGADRDSATQKARAPPQAQRTMARGCHRRKSTAGRLSARRRAADRREDRVRWRRVRGMHRPHRRRGGPFLPHVGGALRWAQHRDHRRPRATGPAGPTAAGVSREARNAMRILHAWHDHGGGGFAAPQCSSRRGRDPRCALRQSLSVHRLREDHRVGEGGSGDDAMTADPGGNGRRNGKRRGVPLIDGLEKVTGRARYTADLEHADALVGRVFRSPVSHGEIVRLDVSRARAVDGVVAVVTGEDCPYTYGVLPVAMNEYPLARERVRYRGEPVAAVAAIDAETATRALDLIEFEVRELPAYYTSAEARSPG